MSVDALNSKKLPVRGQCNEEPGKMPLVPNITLATVRDDLLQGVMRTETYIIRSHSRTLVDELPLLFITGNQA